MSKKKKDRQKNRRSMLSAYSIIMILIIALGIISHLLPKAKFIPVSLEAESEESSEETSAEAAKDEAENPTNTNDAENTEKTTEEALSETITNSEASTTAQPVNSVENTTIITSNTIINGVDLEVEDGEITETPDLVAESTNDQTTYSSLEACEEESGAEECAIVDGSGVVGAKLWQVLMAPILGFENAIDVCIFIMILGGFLAVVARTKALENGIKFLVKKLHGKEYLLIILLMLIFSVMGTTYGFLEESVGFYVLVAATMFAAGLDPLVSVATILLGAGSGVLGSTINPFATGVALSAMKDADIAYDQGMIILIATVLWLSTLAISMFFTIRYAKKVQKDKGSTFLSLREQAAAERTYNKYLQSKDEDNTLSGHQKLTLVIFALTFLVMITGFIPWEEFGVTFFNNWTGWLTGATLGNWWFYEAALWFLISSIIIAIINRSGERGFVDTFVSGAGDMIGVVLVVAVARGVSVIMGQTFLDNFIVFNASNFLTTLPEMLFVPLNYILHIILSILVPSSSGLATMSTPIIAPIANTLGYSTNVTAMTIVAANGLVNLITPTCGAIMGGLALAKVDYPTWFRWGMKVVGTIAIVNIVILCLFSL